MKYVGWGATSNAFAPQPPEEWQSVASELKGLLNTEEYASARASTPNAHYTSPEVVQAVWQAVERFGLQPGAHILEPSMGVGHFFGREFSATLRSGGGKWRSWGYFGFLVAGLTLRNSLSHL